jgi:hypothetical protein
MGAEKGPHETAGRNDLPALTTKLIERHPDEVASKPPAPSRRLDLGMEEDDAPALLPEAREPSKGIAVEELKAVPIGVPG